jgi:hypothetical protein
MMISRQQFMLIAGILSLFFGGCGRQQHVQTPQEGHNFAPLSEPPEVTSQSEEGFHDLIFFIQEHKTLADGSQTIRASGVHRGRQLGLMVTLGGAWKEASLGKDVPIITYSGTVTYCSVGQESDAFLSALDELYGTKLNPTSMGTKARFTAISLGGEPLNLMKGPVKIKLFYESGRDDDYAELFTNIELAARRLEIREKDEEYRLPIVRALRAR